MASLLFCGKMPNSPEVDLEEVDPRHPEFGDIVAGAYAPLLAKDSKMDGPEVRFWDDCC